MSALEDHHKDGDCGHRYANKDEDKHKWTYGICTDSHAYWACESKAHKKISLSCGHYYFKCNPWSLAERMSHAIGWCNWCHQWVWRCKSLVVDCNGSHSGHSFDNTPYNNQGDTGNQSNNNIIGNDDNGVNTNSNAICPREGCDTTITAGNAADHAFDTCDGCNVGYYNCDSDAVYAHAWVACRRADCPRKTGTGSSNLFWRRRCQGNPSGIDHPFSCTGGLPHDLR